jgi:branched-chain amino acid transport system permease protein
VLALALNLQWGYTGLFNISVAAFWGIGAYTATVITKPPGDELLFAMGLPFFSATVFGIPLPIPIAILAAGLVAGIVAALISIPTLRLRDDYLAIATLGLAEIIRLVLLNESWLSGGAQGTSVDNPLIKFDFTNLILLSIAATLLVLTYVCLEKSVNSPWGRALRAVRMDDRAAMSLGKNAFSLKFQSMVIGSALMGMAGALIALRINYLVPDQFLPVWTFYIWIAVIIGGSGNNRGALLGAFILTALLELPRFLAEYIPQEFGGLIRNMRLLTIGIILIIIVTYRPGGILGERDFTSGTE